MPLISNPQHGTLHSTAAIAAAAQQLLQVEPRFGLVIERYGLPPVRQTQQGLAGLLRLITFQSISTKAASAIWQRLEELLASYHPEDILSLSVERLQQAGLTRSKAQSFLALASACQIGSLNFEDLAQQPDETAVNTLCQHKGIGRWTAQLYLLSALGRPDIMPEGDLAVKSAAAELFAIKDGLSSVQLGKLATGWRPWRSVAALILWQAYSAGKISGTVKPHQGSPNDVPIKTL